MKILIVSSEAWCDTNNGGNVLSNIFGSFPDADIAQIYCSGDLPQNSICQKYYQISDSMLLSHEKGRKLEERSYSTNTDVGSNIIENRVKRNIPAFFREAALFAREILWTVSNWKTKDLDSFVSNFQPDIIFAPCYSYYHVSKVALYAKSIAKCPMISYISDDNYSLKQVHISPSFWINRLITRKWIRKHFAQSALVYTMTEMQKQEYEAMLKRPMKVLCKSASFSEDRKKTGSPIRLIYAGGLYLNRWKILIKLSRVLAVINRLEVKAEMHIYSGSKLSPRQAKRLNDKKNCYLYGAVSYDELIEKYKESDIAIHVESFDLKNRLITRLSFSTKIIDCMNSGCAILAIGPDTQAGISYLKENDAAICVNDLKELYDHVNSLIDNPDLINAYALKANQLGRKKHQKADIEKNIRLDFYDVISNNT